MELRKFVEEVLVQVAAGVVDANGRLGPLGAVANPTKYRTHRKSTGSVLDYERLPYPTVEQIEFDVAVTVSQQSGTQGKLAVMAGVIGAGTSGASNESHRTESRVRFSIPLVLPNAEHKP